MKRIKTKLIIWLGIKDLWGSLYTTNSQIEDLRFKCEFGLKIGQNISFKKNSIHLGVQSGDMVITGKSNIKGDFYLHGVVIKVSEGCKKGDLLTIRIEDKIDK